MNTNAYDDALSDVNSQDGMLVFKSVEHYLNALEQIGGLSEEERTEWEQSRKFKSFGRVADEFFDTFDIEKFSSYSEVESFFAEHSDLLTMEEGKGNEITISGKYITLTDRWLLNEKMMYIVDNSVSKYYPDEDVTVSTDINDVISVNLLKNANDKNWKEFENNSNFKVFTSQIVTVASTAISSSTQPGKPSFLRDKLTYEKTVGSNRARLYIETKVKTHGTWFTGYVGYSTNVEYTMINEVMKRALGFLWYYGQNTTRKVQGYIKVTTNSCVWVTSYGVGYNTTSDYTQWDFNHSFKSENKNKQLQFQSDMSKKKPWVGLNISNQISLSVLGTSISIVD